MIGYLDGQAPRSDLFRYSLRHRPALEHAVLFQPEVKVQGPCPMFLNDKSTVRVLAGADAPSQPNPSKAMLRVDGFSSTANRIRSLIERIDCGVAR